MEKTWFCTASIIAYVKCQRTNQKSMPKVEKKNVFESSNYVYDVFENIVNRMSTELL